MRLGKPRTIRRYKTESAAQTGLRQARRLGNASVKSLNIKTNKKSSALRVRPIIIK